MVDAGRIVRWGLGAFVGIVALEHLLRRDLPPADHFVSEYAVGWTHPLQAVAFVAWAGATAGCTVLAARVNARRIARAVVGLGLAAASGGRCREAVFSTKTVAGELPAGVQRTTAGRLH